MIKQQLLQRLTNLWYKYNDGKIISSLGYNEVSFKYNTAQLFNKVYETSEKFYSDFFEIVWVSYRKNYKPLPDTVDKQIITSDCGWGCMIRCSQMLLAQTIKRACSNYTRGDIIRHFLDVDKSPHPFSLSELVKYGAKYEGRKPGEWYGVHSISYVLTQIFNSKPNCHKEPEIFKRLGLVVFSNNAVVRSKIEEALEDT